jgi:hypothetical protein
MVQKHDFSHVTRRSLYCGRFLFKKDMYRKMMVVGFLWIAAHPAKAQLPAILGMVRDSVSKQVLEEATVSLLLEKKLIRQSRGGQHGFAFRNVIPGDYFLVTSYLGYALDSLKIHVDSMDKKVMILLHPSTKAMMQVVGEHHRWTSTHWFYIDHYGKRID